MFFNQKIWLEWKKSNKILIGPGNGMCWGSATKLRYFPWSPQRRRSNSTQAHLLWVLTKFRIRNSNFGVTGIGSGIGSGSLAGSSLAGSACSAHCSREKRVQMHWFSLSTKSEIFILNLQNVESSWYIYQWNHVLSNQNRNQHFRLKLKIFLISLCSQTLRKMPPTNVATSKFDYQLW